MKLPKYFISVDEGHGKDFTVFIVIKLESGAGTSVQATVIEVIKEDFQKETAITKDTLINFKLNLLKQKYELISKVQTR